MCQKASGPLNHIAFLLLVLAFLACGLCFAAPFWVVFPHAFKQWKVESIPSTLPDTHTADAESANSIGIAWKGLLGYCFSDVKCVWFWENDFSQEKGLPDWYKASQGVFAGAMIALIFAVLIQAFYGCCCTRSCCYPTVVASFVIVGAILAGTSLGLFGGFAARDGWFDQMRSGGYIAKLEWAFYTGIAGAGTAFISAVFFYIDGCKTRRYHEYTEAPKSPSAPSESSEGCCC